MLPTIKLLAEDVIYVSQSEIPTLVGDDDYRGGAVPGTQSKLAVVLPRGSLAYH